MPGGGTGGLVEKRKRAGGRKTGFREMVCMVQVSRSANESDGAWDRRR